MQGQCISAGVPRDNICTDPTISLADCGEIVWLQVARDKWEQRIRTCITLPPAPMGGSHLCYLTQALHQRRFTLYQAAYPRTLHQILLCYGWGLSWSKWEFAQDVRSRNKATITLWRSWIFNAVTDRKVPRGSNLPSSTSSGCQVLLGAVAVACHQKYVVSLWLAILFSLVPRHPQLLRPACIYGFTDQSNLTFQTPTSLSPPLNVSRSISFKSYF